MAFKKPADVGSIDIEERHDTYEGSPETMYYPGYVPQYNNPRITHVVKAEDQVPNHIDRGGYSHGTEYASDSDEKEMLPKDSYKPVDIGDEGYEEVYPEKDYRRDTTPVPVEIVNRDPIQRTRMDIDMHFIGTPAVTTTSQNQQNGLTPVRVLAADPHRVRALLAITGTITTQVPMIVSGPTGNPAYGWPLSSATTNNYLELFTDDEVWVSGSAAGDTFNVVVLIERKYNADPKHSITEG